MAAVNVTNNPQKVRFGIIEIVLSGLVLVSLTFVIWQILFLEGLSGSDGFASLSNGIENAEETRLRAERVNRKGRPNMTAAIFDETPWLEGNTVNAKIRYVEQNSCGYSRGLYNLTENELHPKAGDRHMVTPPEGGKYSLVCCETTKGNLAIVAHHNWAPLGAARFITMVKDRYFDSTVPMMRCIKDWLCQFGLNSDKKMSKKYNSNLKDDKPWLPQGPKFRQNEDGVKRFAQGYLAYAGGGPNTRGNQFIVSLTANGPLAGGSPWEVPWGELVGDESFETISKIYTGYGDNGPPQGKLANRGMDEELKEEFPELDYINNCVVVHEEEVDVITTNRVEVMATQ